MALYVLQALLNLDLLLKSNSMSSANRQNLFPSTESLLSFDIEFGVPLYLQEEPDEDYTLNVPEESEIDYENSEIF